MEKESKTFKPNDRFDREGFADRLTTVINKFSPFYDESFVLSLNAKFGAGKTTFLEMWGNKLEASSTVIRINAWETDFDEEPLIPIISALLEGLKDDQKIKNTLIGVIGAGALMSNDVLAHTTGINPYRTMQKVEDELVSRNIKALGKKIYAGYSFKKKAYEELKEALREYVERTDKKPLVIFVDELDRVRPDYAVKFLEAIKHIFSVQGVCFVLAVNREQLEVSIRQLYGSDIDFENYYRRFITREVSLPELTKVDLMPFLGDLSADFFDEKRALGIHFPFKQEDQKRTLGSISDICKAFDFNPRQIECFFRVFSQFMAVENESTIANPVEIDSAIFLIAVFIRDRALYDNIEKSSLSPHELHDYFKELEFNKLGIEKEQRWLYTIMGASLNEGEYKGKDEPEDLIDICLPYYLPKKYGTSPVDISSRDEDRRFVCKILRGPFGNRQVGDESVFQEIYNRLEEWKEFIA